MVTDKLDRGLPGGVETFAHSFCVTAANVRTLFLIIRSLLPDFAPKTIVTDEAACFCNSYRVVFPNMNTRLHYCRFHIIQSWRKKTKQLVEVRTPL
ncbi:unnamed protein product [Nippostrongylus brasiliensis]|uniref:MULE domain-containing protein n=1 Tax=Nippostrongylus brasiliensis TaxID=27835 RepID=A0A0N4XVY9_NIPBR|nr:unnamed protein product [Nippostrongylus brasiliensis]